jgi:hypothetical protein
VGNDALWYFDARPGDWIDIHIDSPWAPTTGGLTKRLEPLDRSYCFLVKAGGSLHYTGDSVHNNCTPE